MPEAPRPRLRDLPFGVRAGVTFLIFTMMGGLFASLVYLRDHYRNRDEDPELTMRDLEGAYRGATIPAPLLTALERGHPPELPQGDRETLLAWLRGPNVAENYENFDMGPPADLIAASCVSCHTRAAAADPASGIRHALEVSADVLKLVHTREMRPTPDRVLVISTHAHATTLAMVGVLAIGLMVLSFWPRWLVSIVAVAIGLGLALDIAGWWTARYDRNFLYAIVVGGGLFNAGVWLALLMGLVELWRPRFGRRG